MLYSRLNFVFDELAVHPSIRVCARIRRAACIPACRARRAWYVMFEMLSNTICRHRDREFVLPDIFQQGGALLVNYYYFDRVEERCRLQSTLETMRPYYNRMVRVVETFIYITLCRVGEARKNTTDIH